MHRCSAASWRCVNTRMKLYFYCDSDTHTHTHTQMIYALQPGIVYPSEVINARSREQLGRLRASRPVSLNHTTVS